MQSVQREGVESVSQISQHDYDAMTDSPEKISIIVSNSLGEHYVSQSLVTLHKVNSKVKVQFSFNASNANAYPLNWAWLYINGDMKGVYSIKPAITDICAVKALNFEWEI